MCIAGAVGAYNESTSEVFMSEHRRTQFADGRQEEHVSESYRTKVARWIYVPIAIGAILLAAIFGGLGVMLVYLGAKGTTHLELFGQKMDTADVGVASIFIGAVVVILLIRSVLKSVERSFGLSGTRPLEYEATDAMRNEAAEEAREYYKRARAVADEMERSKAVEQLKESSQQSAKQLP
jgi:uncharacterized membrane protein YcjF (UPF0283 family)